MLLALLIMPELQAQSKMKYKRQLKKEAKENALSDLPIQLDPIEEIPEQHTDRFVAEAALNWGNALLMQDSINILLFQKAKYPVTIKNFDTGGKYDHDWLKFAKLGRSYTGEGGLEDLHGHSTHVAGIEAGYKENDRVGYCSALVQRGLLTMVPIKVLGNDGSGSFPNVDNAIVSEDNDNKAIINSGGYVIVNGSFGGGVNKLGTTEAALKRSTELGVRYVFAAGNDAGPVNYPGNSQYVICTASLDQNLSISSYSSRGPEVDECMPGRSIYSTYKGNTFATLSGTSMATPALTAAVAIMFSVHGPNAPKTVAEIKRYLAWCSTDVAPAGKNPDSGWGYLFIRNIIMRDPRTIPAGFPGGGGGTPTDPVPPTPVPGLPTRELRTVKVDLKGPFTMIWSNIGAAGTQNLSFNKWDLNADPYAVNTPRNFTVKSKTEVKGFNTLTITDLSLTIQTNVQDDDIAEVLKAGCEAFFKNRGLVLNANDGFTEALQWSVYFADMYLMQEKKIVNVDFVTGVGTSQRGNVTRQSGFKRWPVQ